MLSLSWVPPGEQQRTPAMKKTIIRRDFVKTSALAAAALPALLRAEPGASTPSASPAQPNALPMGRIGGVEFSRLMLGGNLISGWAHSRDLRYFMAKVQKPWIAFKILAAGAIPPRTAFPYTVNGGADFMLVGMFDWQIEENSKLAKRVIEATACSTTSRTRPWYGVAT